jgi:hypothetical protein
LYEPYSAEVLALKYYFHHWRIGYETLRHALNLRHYTADRFAGLASMIGINRKGRLASRPFLFFSVV